MRSLFQHSVLVLFLYITKCSCFYTTRHVNRPRTFVNVAKYDKDRFVRVSIPKPLGIGLEEVEENGKRGVYVFEVNEGNAKNSKMVTKGLFLLEVNGNDVKYADFEAVFALLKSAPDDKPIDLTFIDLRAIQKGPAVLTLNIAEGKTMQIQTLKGAKLRDVILSANVELYPGSARLTNCGGGGSCGTCAVTVTDNADWEPRPVFEAQRLKKYDPTARLSCNTIIEGDCTVTLLPKKTQ